MLPMCCAHWTTTRKPCRQKAAADASAQAALGLMQQQYQLGGASYLQLLTGAAAGAANAH